MQFYLRQVIGAKQVVDTNTILKWDFVRTLVRFGATGWTPRAIFLLLVYAELRIGLHAELCLVKACDFSFSVDTDADDCFDYQPNQTRCDYGKDANCDDSI